MVAIKLSNSKSFRKSCRVIVVFILYTLKSCIWNASNHGYYITDKTTNIHTVHAVCNHLYCEGNQSAGYFEAYGQTSVQYNHGSWVYRAHVIILNQMCARSRRKNELDATEVIYYVHVA